MSHQSDMWPRSWETDPECDAARRKERRRWRDKFREAIRGVKLGVRGHSSFCIHFFFAATALAAALALQCTIAEWCLIVFAIGLVLSVELLNSAVETLFHCLDADTKKRMGRPLDIAAGAVLVASLTAAVVGVLVLGRRLLVLFHVWEM
jgi:diacylglycerol kinase